MDLGHRRVIRCDSELEQYVLGSEVVPFYHENCLQTFEVCSDISQCSFSASEWMGVSLCLFLYTPMSVG